jgi:photosystem II stability/assembly factor-like uncharacterized protein
MAIIFLIVSGKVFSHTIVVTNSNDSITGSLRDAINKAQSGDTIRFDKSLTEINLGEQINIYKSITISGNPGLLIHDNRWGSTSTLVRRFFEIKGSDSIVVNINDLKFGKKKQDLGLDTINKDGQIILIENIKSTVNIKFCYFEPEHYSFIGSIRCFYAPNGSLMSVNGKNGGAIAQYGGDLNISNSTFSQLVAGNSSYWGAGGAICQFGGKLKLVNCTFYKNSAGVNSCGHFLGVGSAIYSQKSIVSITNCTFCEHPTDNFYMPVPTPSNPYPSPVTSTTYTIILDSSDLVIKNSIFYNNDGRDLAGDVNSTFRSGGYNIFDQTLSVNDGASPTDQFNCNPGFILKKFCDAPYCNTGVVLSSNTFWIPVCALDAAGPAIDALPSDGNGAPLYDQRGHARINTPDIGAYEFEGCIPAVMKAKWNTTKFGQNSWAFDISVVDDNVVWVKDANSDSISVTTNGGASWITKPLPVIAGYIRTAGGICALSDVNAYYILSLSDAKGIYMTTDGGNTWNKQTTAFTESNSFPDVIHFWNENEGVAIGDALPNFEIYTTSNGGTQWNRVPDANMPNGNTEGTWNSQGAYKVVGTSIFFITSSARIFKSVDKGKTWSVTNTPFHNSADSTITFDFKDNTNGLVSYCSNDGLHHKIYKTTNGGLTWDSISTSNFYQRMKYIPAANAYFSMNINGGLSYSCDDGQTWTSVSYYNGIKLRTVDYSVNGKIFWGGLGYIYYSSPVLAISPYNLTIAAPANSTQTFTIESTTDWFVASNQTWLAVSSSTGSGNSTIIVTVAANPVAASRTATITVSGTGVATQTITVTQQGISTSLPAIAEKDFLIYPNPAGSVLYFSSKAETTRISIFDIYGKLVLDQKVNSDQIDIGNLRNGVYTIKIRNPKGIVTKKFIKQ